VYLSANEQSIVSEPQLTLLASVLNRWTASGFVIRRAEIWCPDASEQRPIYVNFLVETESAPARLKERISLAVQHANAAPMITVTRWREGKRAIVAAEGANVSEAAADGK